MDNITVSAQAILLLTSRFSKKSTGSALPLSPSEWGRFALWLHQHDMKPEDLLETTFDQKLVDWSDEKITLDRLRSLLNRGAALALAMEKWQRIGLWVITRSDPEYPVLLKKRLKHLSPPILYCAGNKKLLNKQSVAVVGTRKAPDDALKYAFALGERIASDGYTLVSGGAKGVDDAAMQGALNAGGGVIGILAENLLKASLSSQYRNALIMNELVLISPYYPEAPFSTGNAMARNKYIYTMSLSAVVVHSDMTGGTWSGASEALKHAWVPVWVKEPIDSKSANQKLIDLGANLLTSDVLQSDIGELSTGLLAAIKPQKQQSLFENTDIVSAKEITTEVPQEEEIRNVEFATDSLEVKFSFFDFFISKLKELYKTDTIFKPKEVEKEFDLKSSQIDAWLSRAEDEKIIKKLNGRIRKYQLI